MSVVPSMADAPEPPLKPDKKMGEMAMLSPMHAAWQGFAPTS